MSTITVQSIQRNLAVENARENLAALTKHFESVLRELHSYRARFEEEAKDDPAAQAKVLGWTIHYASTNVAYRLDLLSQSATELALAARNVE